MYMIYLYLYAVVKLHCSGGRSCLLRTLCQPQQIVFWNGRRYQACMGVGVRVCVCVCVCVGVCVGVCIRTSTVE